MKENRKIYGVLLALSLIAGGYVVAYYWMTQGLEQLRVLPVHLIVALFTYIFLQIVKRQWFSRRNWWDWLYYLGLLSAVLPTYLATEENVSTFSLVAQFGTFFLLIPIFLDGKTWLNERK